MMQMDNVRGSFSSWRGRGSLADIAKELERQIDARVDFVADTRQMAIETVETEAVDTSGKKRTMHDLRLVPKSPQVAEFIPDEGVPILDQALTQVAGKASPQGSHGVTFFKKLREVNPQACADFLTRLMHDKPARRLVRCLDGAARAFLGETYRCVDNFGLALNSAEQVMKLGGEVVEASLSDSHMRIKYISKEVWDRIEQERTKSGGWNYAGGMGNQSWLKRVSANTEGDLPGGPDTVWPVVTLSNSETGHGRTTTDLGLLLAYCWNLAVVENVLAEVHIGEKLTPGIFTKETIESHSKTMLLKLRDAIDTGFQKEKFERLVARVTKSQEDEIHAVAPAVDLVIANTDVGETQRDALLQYFVKDYDATRFGLGQAVARLAQDVHDGDKAHELEKVAGEIMKGRGPVSGTLDGERVNVFEPVLATA